MSKRKNLLLTVICAMVIGLMTFGGAILKSDGFFTLAADFNEQQLPFAAAAWEGVRSGSSWLWGVDLGSSLITTFSFYNLGSPFFWITLLFPKDAFPWLAGFLFILKYMVAAGAGYVYLSRFTKERTAVIGGLIYAFSGFQATNLMFFHFHDAVAFFPLLLAGLEDFLREKKKAGFIFAAFLNCLVNYFFFLQEVVFLILYFLFRMWKKQSLRGMIGQASECLLCGLLGVGMAGVLFVPSIIYVLGNDRSGFAISLAELLYEPADLLHIVKGILLPGDAMDSLSSVIMFDYSSASAYLPLFGITCALAYIIRKRDWLGKLLILLTLLALFPYGNGLFLLLRGIYCRWWYMWTMMMALATVKVLDEPKSYPLRGAAMVSLGLLVALFLGIRWLALNPESDILIYDGYLHRNFFLAAGLGAVLLLLPFPQKHREWILLVLTCAFCAGTSYMTLEAYLAPRYQKWEPNEVKDLYRAGLRLKNPDDQYRFDSTENLLMIPGDTGGYGAFVSTAENESYRFSGLMDVYFVSNTGEEFRGEIAYLPQLLGAKYEFMEVEPEEAYLDSFKVGEMTYYITERKACPIGFAVNQWISGDDLLSVSADQRAAVLMNAFVAEGRTREMAISAQISEAVIQELVELNPEESIARTEREAVRDFRRNGHGFTCSTVWNQDQMVYFTVPYDVGWQAKIDGEKAEVYNSGGMMVLWVPGGTHEIEMTYHTPGFVAGAILSGVSFVLFALLLFFWRRRSAFTEMLRE